MSQKCANPDCYVHDGESCVLGENHYSECHSWSSKALKDDKPITPESDASRVPWSGSTFGLADLTNLVPRGRSILVGVLGSQDSGKTPLLTGSYLQILKGNVLAQARFAGSRTLGAWESLAAWIRFEDAARSPSFPPHTPRGTSRVPGLLHLALRNENDEFRDVLLTDAPGEWFTKWSVKEDAAEAEGARWVVEHADAFLVLADCKRLCGDGRGQARSDIRSLLERLGNHVANRPTILAWAKADQTPPDGIKKAIRRALNEHIPHATEVTTTTDEPESLITAMSELLLQAWMPAQAQIIEAPVLKDEPYLAFRGNHENT